MTSSNPAHSSVTFLVGHGPARQARQAITTAATVIGLIVSTHHDYYLPRPFSRPTGDTAFLELQYYAAFHVPFCFCSTRASEHRNGNGA
jgi:hypothetical protein